jgi:hypothetical protein
MATHGFDGVDIALEFPDQDVPEDRTALTILLEVKKTFDRCASSNDQLVFVLFLGIGKTKTFNVTIDDYIDSCTVC